MRMTETTKNSGEKLSVTPTKTLTLKRPGVEQGVVRQSFSHGRSKAVVVEKVKHRIVGRADALKETTPAAPAAKAPAPSPAVANRPAPSPAVAHSAPPPPPAPPVATAATPPPPPTPAPVPA